MCVIKRINMLSYNLRYLLAAGMFCVAPQLRAQLISEFNQPPSFALLAEPGMSGSRLGIGLRDIDADRAGVIKLGDPRGVEVESVLQESPAARAGIKRGDVLLSYNGESIMGADQLIRLVSETPPGRKVRIEYWREGKTLTVTVITAAPQVIPYVTQRPMPWQSANPLGGIRKAQSPLDLPNPGETEMKLRALAIAESIPKPELIWRTPLFGIECEPLQSQLAEYFGVKHGVLIRSVIKDSTAAKAGLRAGDVVTQIGEHSVADPRDLTSYIRTERHANGPVALEVTREHRPVSVKVTLAQDEQQ
jgi:serine protease Do